MATSCFFNMSKSKLKDALMAANIETLSFRKKLSLPPSITFGNEIEVNDLDLSSASKIVSSFNNIHHLNNNNGFAVTEDYSVASEIITPILKDKESHWNSFGVMYDTLKMTSATIGKNTSSHVHIGMEKIDSFDKLSTLIKTLVVFEPIIFMFGYGYGDQPREFIKAKPFSSIYSMVMTPSKVASFVNMLDFYFMFSDDAIIKQFNSFNNNDNKYRAVFNFRCFDIEKLLGYYKCNDHMEVRCFNGTLDKEIAQNNINLVASIVNAVASDRIDSQYIDTLYYQYINLTYNYDCYVANLDARDCDSYNRLLASYRMLDLNKALKLADMVFVDDRDKLYFLKQYLKLFNKNEEYVNNLLKQKEVIASL